MNQFELFGHWYIEKPIEQLVFFKFELSYSIKLDYNNHQADIIDYPDIELVSKEITGIRKQIYNLCILCIKYKGVVCTINLVII